MQLDLVWKDVLVAGRNARRRPGFALLVVTTLAIGLGVNAAVFALADAILLRPLPYRQPERIVFLWQTLPQHHVFDVEATPADYTAWHALKSFSSLAMIAADTHTLAGDVEPERVRGARVTASLMPLLGVAPAIGRAFTPAEDESGVAPVAILSDALWRRRYGADPHVVGRVVVIDGTPHTVVGIMPASAMLPGPVAANSDLWLPARLTPEERTNDISHNYTIVGRLADGVTVARASSELATYPTADAFRHSRADRSMGARAVPIAEATAAQIRPALIALLAGVAVLLLTATANVATLLVSRSVSRAREVAIRTALGAGRARLMRLAIVETVGLAVLGASAGLAIGAVLLRALLPLFQGALPRTGAAPHIDAEVTAVTVGIAMLLGMGLGAGSSHHDRERSLSASLRAGGRTSAAPPSTRARRALVVAQVGFAVILLAVAGLMVQSRVRLAHVSPGFAADHLLTFRLPLDSSAYADPARREAFAADLIRELAARPGLATVALTSQIPLGGARGASLIDIEGRTPTPGELPIIDQRRITPDYFRAMRIPMLAGRELVGSDRAHGEEVAVVNRAMAERYWPGATPVDRRVRLAAGFDSGHWIRIVGVVENVHHLGLTRAPVPEMYRPYAQAPDTAITVVARTVGDPAAATGICRAAVRALDRHLPLYDLRTMDDRLAASLAQTHATTILLAMTAMLAALLAAVAVYGSNWYAVVQRVPEFGIRLALGATRASIWAQVVGGALWQTALGTALGAAALAAARPLFAGLLFETRPGDPATLAGVAVVVAAVTLTAAAGPARRAVNVDPLTALRDE